MSFEPQAFGKYYLVDKIATGGMAEIFKAKTFSHGGFENLLVIKRILAHLGENEDFVDMFIDEAKVSVALQHPNIVRIYDFGKILDNYFIAMEYLEGKDVRNVLRKLARRRQFFPVEYAVYVAIEACKGLHHAHTKTDLHGQPYGIVHRDVSPSNLLVSYDGHVKVADFGIAKAESNAYNTRDGVLKGKFEYMSPEQARGDPIDHRSDIFSLGIILYEMLTGRRLFKTDSDTATLEKIKAVDIYPPSSLNSRIPQPLEYIVLKALARDREDRYQTAAELQEDLQDFLFPATSDSVCASLDGFMAELFADEIADERRRLEAGSKVAARLHKEAPPAAEWDGTADSTLTAVVTRGSRWALLLLPILLVLILFMGGGVAALFGLGVLEWPAPETIVETPTTGSLVVVMVPEGRIFLDGELAVEGGTLELDGLEPRTWTLRLEAEGYEPVEETVTVAAGEMARVTHSLVALEVPDEPVDTPRTADPVAVTRLTFHSDPPGATVFVDGRVVGKTPFTWSGAQSSRTYSVEYELDGHQRASGTAGPVPRGERQTFSLRLRPVAVAPGSLTVGIIGGGWATVTIDGIELSQTAPLRGHSLRPGAHTITVSNPDLGIDHTEVIEVHSGQASTIRVRPQ